MLAPLGGDFDGNAKFWDLEFSAAVPKVTSPPRRQLVIDVARLRAFA